MAPSPLAAPDLLQDLEESFPAMFYQFLLRPDRSESFHYVSPAAAEIFELSLEEIKQDARKVLALIHPEDRLSHEQKVAASEKNMEKFKWEGRYLLRSGRVKWLKVFSTPRALPDGSIMWSGILTDVTQEKIASSQLHLLRQLIDHSGDAIMVTDASGNFIFVNTEACQRLDYQKQELLALNLQQVAPAYLAGLSWSAYLASLKEKGAMLLCTKHLRQDGSSFPVEVKINYAEVGGKGFVVAFSRDITDRTEVEEKLRVTDQLLRGVNQAARILLTEEDYQEAIKRALGIIGKSADADRVYIFENHTTPNGVHCLSQKYEWVKDSISIQLENPDLQNMPYLDGGLGRWWNDLSQGTPVKGLVKDFPASERALLEPQDILSLLVVPIFIDNRFWGFIGFDDCTKNKEWTRAEENILVNLAHSIGGAIATHRKKEELRRAKELAEQGTLAKSEFLSSMSHELRTPLHAVIGITHLLLHGNPRHEQIEHLKVLKFSSENLLSIINDILDFSKIEAGKIEFEEVTFNLHELISNVRQAFAQQAEEKNLSLKVMLDADLPQAVMGDPVRLAQILTNIVGNAVKFTEKGGMVIEAAQKRKDRHSVTVDFAVRDTGIGIPADRLPYIFDSFTQASTDTTRRFGGTGLGLAITNRLLQLLGSQIQVESELGRGSRFFFSLPLKKASEFADTVSYEPVLKEIRSLKGSNVLIAEDNVFNQFLAKEFLQRWDIRADIAQNGREALKLVQQKDYDLVLMDLQMPDMDGFEATAEIRNLPEEKYQTLPIIALTASATLDIKDRTEAAGMNGFVTKPFHPDELYRKIEKYSKPVKNRMVPSPLV